MSKSKKSQLKRPETKYQEHSSMDHSSTKDDERGVTNTHHGGDESPLLIPGIPNHHHHDHDDEDHVHDASPINSNNLGQLVQKSYLKVKQTVAQKSQNVNDQFIAKACQLWSKLHSTSAPVPFSDFQNQLMGVYQEVLNKSNEIKRTLSGPNGDSIIVRVKKLSQSAVMVSIKGLYAIVNFAEQKVEILLPQQSTQTSYAIDRFANSPVVNKLRVSFDTNVQSGLPKRIISLPLTVTFRILKSVNLRGYEALALLQSTTRSHLDKLANSLALNKYYSDLNRLSSNLREHAVEHIQFNIVKDYAAFYAKRIVQLRRDVYDSIERQADRLKNSQQVELLRRQLAIVKPYVVDMCANEQVKIMQQRLLNEIVMPLYDRILMTLRANSALVRERIMERSEVLMKNGKLLKDMGMEKKSQLVENVGKLRQSVVDMMEKNKSSVLGMVKTAEEKYMPVAMQKVMRNSVNYLSNSW